MKLERERFNKIRMRKCVRMDFKFVGDWIQAFGSVILSILTSKRSSRQEWICISLHVGLPKGGSSCHGRKLQTRVFFPQNSSVLVRTE
ncbi:hypothetical protein V6Z12_A06G163400 [Gossypium hirsutum]